LVCEGDRPRVQYDGIGGRRGQLRGAVVPRVGAGAPPGDRAQPGCPSPSRCRRQPNTRPAVPARWRTRKWGSQVAALPGCSSADAGLPSSTPQAGSALKTSNDPGGIAAASGRGADSTRPAGAGDGAAPVFTAWRWWHATPSVSRALGPATVRCYW